MGAQQDDETESLPALTLEQCIAQIDDWANQNIAKSADAANAFRHCAQFLKERCKAEPPIESGRCPQLYRLTDAAVEDMTLEQATNVMSNRVYSTALLAAQLEHKGKATCSGHHFAQHVAAFAEEELRKVWNSTSETSGANITEIKA